MSIFVQHENLPQNRRILVTSDIHGHLTHFKQLLTNAAFSERDILIIVGDIIEKGPQSLQTLRYIMELYRRGNVIVLAGNVDLWRVQMMEALDTNTASDFYGYLERQRSWKGTSLVDEMAKELGLVLDSPERLLAAKDVFLTHFHAEYDFLRSRPHIVDTQNFIFVHAGLPQKDIASLVNGSPYDVLGYNNFMASGLTFDKYVVVGHWPVSLYSDIISQSNPIINQKQKIISIDGGLGLKPDGQLNLLILPHIDCAVEDISWLSYDEFPIGFAENEQNSSTDSINIQWGDNQIRLLEIGHEFSTIEHIRTGRKLKAPTNWLYENNQKCKDFTDRVLKICPGDKLSIIFETSVGYYVKKDGITGWYYGKLI